MGVEPTYAAWEAAVLPMNYSCIWKSIAIIPDLFSFCKPKIGAWHECPSALISSINDAKGITMKKLAALLCALLVLGTSAH